MPTNSWVSAMGVRLHRRPWYSPQATQASATAVPRPISVSAIPLPRW